MVMLEALAVIGVAGLVIYALLRTVLSAPAAPKALESAGSWRVTHYDSGGRTRVVVQRLSPSGSTVRDEHLIAGIPVDAPDYDEQFVAAMAAARQRKAMFEVEED